MFQHHILWNCSSIPCYSSRMIVLHLIRKKINKMIFPSWETGSIFNYIILQHLNNPTKINFLFKIDIRTIVRMHQFLSTLYFRYLSDVYKYFALVSLKDSFLFKKILKRRIKKNMICKINLSIVDIKLVHLIKELINVDSKDYTIYILNVFFEHIISYYW